MDASVQKKFNAGFTLIEVLVAMVILSIALTAVIHATSQHIRNNLYLQEKTKATWVGVEVINETQAGLITVPNESDYLEKNTDILGSRFSWQAYLHPTNNSRIAEIHVDVFRNKKKMTHLMGYLYS